MGCSAASNMEMWVQVKFRAVASAGVFRCRWGPVPLQVRLRSVVGGAPVPLQVRVSTVAGPQKSADLRRKTCAEHKKRRRPAQKRGPATLLSLTCDGKPVQNTKNVAGQPEGRFFCGRQVVVAV